MMVAYGLQSLSLVVFLHTFLYTFFTLSSTPSAHIHPYAQFTQNLLNSPYSKVVHLEHCIILVTFAGYISWSIVRFRSGEGPVVRP